MTDNAFLSVFTPSRTAPEDLESIFVQRQALLADAVERVHESVTSGNKHHLLFVGSRGTGKTHLVTLLVHRVGQYTELEDRLHIAWLNEDETSTTQLEFLRRIYLSLVKRYPGHYSETSLEPIYDMDVNTAENWLAKLLLEQLRNRTLLVVVENLDALFDGLGEAGQQRLRAFIQEHPVLCIVATAQRLVDSIAKRKYPFFGFFQTEHLETLSVDEAAELLRKIADLNRQPDVAAFLRSPPGRSRVRALHHLSGGNHRIYIVLSQFITRDNIDALVAPFSKMIDEMTPYYQERIRWLPVQQRKIVEFLCTRERPVPVNELARKLFASQQTISSQLKNLREKGYVLSAQRGRESLYEIAEPLMRICVEVKENQSHESMRLLVDFLRVWYDARDLSTRLQACDGDTLARNYLQAAFEKNASLGNLRARLLVDSYRSELDEDQGTRWLSRIEGYTQQSEELGLACGEWAKGNDEKALSILTEITNEQYDAKSIFIRASAHSLAAEIHYKQGRIESTLAQLDQALKMPNLPVEFFAKTLYQRGVTYEQLEKYKQAQTNYSAVISLKGTPIEWVAKALINRGNIYQRHGEFEQAQTHYSTVINLPGVPIECVAKALYNRGVTYGQIGEYGQQQFDYSAIINLSNAPPETLASALYNRGVMYEKIGEYELAIADFSAVINLPQAPVDQIENALYNRGTIFYWQKNNAKSAEQDFEAILALVGTPLSSRVVVRYNITTICIATGRWDDAISTLAQVLTEDAATEPNYVGNAEYIIAAFFDSSLTPGIRRARTRELAKIYQEHNAIPLLGEALTRHLGLLLRERAELPASDNLELWASAWEEAGRDMHAFKIPLRIFRTGIDFLKTGGKDRGILLNLIQEERRILEQALSLDNESK